MKNIIKPLVFLASIGILAAAAYSFYLEQTREPLTGLLLITVDTWRADGLGAYGHPYLDTPNLDQLCRMSAQFTQTTVQTPVTLPSHATIMTGLFPRTHGVESNFEFLEDNFTTLAEILKAEGYKTLGVISGIPLASGISHLHQGFDDYKEFHEEHNPAPVVTDYVLQWIAKQRSGPVFIWAHYYDPHTPYVPPKPFNLIEYSTVTSPELHKEKPKLNATENKFQLMNDNDDSFQLSENVPDKASFYYAEIAAMDRAIGILLDKWFEVAQPARIMIVGDHGESLGEHDYWFNHGRYLFEPSNAVPFIVHGFGEQTGLVIEAPVSTVDILVTVLESLGVSYPFDLPGKSLRTLLRGNYEKESRIVFLQTGSKENDTVKIKTMLHKPELPKHKYLVGVRYENWKLIWQKPRELLFNLAEDPQELNDLSQSEPEMLQRLTFMMDEWMSQTPEYILDNEQELDSETLDKLMKLGYVQ